MSVWLVTALVLAPIASSSAKGTGTVVLETSTGEHAYTVELYFSEPQDLGPGARTFDVRVQGQTVAEGLDVAKEAGGRHVALVKTVSGVAASDTLKIELVPASGSAPPILNALRVSRE